MRLPLERSNPLVVPECYSALTARIAEQAGFEAVYIGSNGASAMHHGIPDLGLITSTELIEIAARISDCIGIPLICDADQGGELGANVARTVRGFERAGVAAIHIEDTLSPRDLRLGRAGLLGAAAMCARITAAVEARRSDDFVLIARSDGLAYELELDEIIERGVVYAQAGADVFWCLGTSGEHLGRLAKEVPIPVMDVDHPVELARRAGLTIALFAGHAVSAAARLHQHMLEQLKTHGRIDLAEFQTLAPDEYRDLADQEGFRALLDQSQSRAA